MDSVNGITELFGQLFDWHWHPVNKQFRSGNACCLTHSIPFALYSALPRTQHRMSDYSITSGDRPLGFLYLPGWVLQVPYFWGGTHVLLSTNHWLKRPIWCMSRPTMLVFAFLLAERRRCRYETLLQWSEHLHRYSMLQISATLHCPEVLVSNRKIWAGIKLLSCLLTFVLNWAGQNVVR